MNKKGFTLIEMVAVIFIIGMLFLIAIPPVTKMVKDNTSSLYDKQLVNIKLAASNWVSDNLETLSSNIDVTITLGELKAGGYVDEDIANPKTGEPFSDDMVIYIKTGEGKDVSYDIDEGTIKDKPADESSNGVSIVLAGDKIEYIEINTPYQERKNVKVIDNTGNEISTTIDVAYKKKVTSDYEDVSNINTTSLSQYQVVYSSTVDGTTVKTVKNVIVRDTVKPVITVNGKTSNQKVLADLNQAYTIPTGTATDNSDEEIEVKVSGNVDTSKEGSYKIVYKASDSSGNEAKLTLNVEVTEKLSCQIEVTPDRATKEAELEIIPSNRLVDGYAFEGEEFSSNTVKTINRNGVYKAKVRDLRGRVAECKVKVENIDNEAPEVLFSHSASVTNGWAKANFDVNVNVTDTSGIKEIKYCQTTDEVCTPNESVSVTEGNKEVDFNLSITTESETNKICVYVKDILGNGQTKCSSDNGLKLDKTGPDVNYDVTEILVGKKTTFNVNINVEDPLSGVDNYLYCISNTENNCTPNIPGTGETINLTELEVTYKICTLAYDKANNSSGVVCSDVYKVTEPLMQKWTSSSTTDFHNSTYKSNILSVNVLNNIPDLTGIATNKKWDVSEKKDKSVMAWVTTNSADSSKYDLHIAGNGGVIANPDSSYLFYNFNFNNTTTMNLSLLDTSRVINMGYMFSSCRGLTSLDLSSFDTSSVKDMSMMFSSCRGLTSLDLSNFNTSSVTGMVGMFSSCNSLPSLDLSSFNTSSVTNMYNMFYSCYSLTSLDLSSFNTSSVTNMDFMFYFCDALPSLDLSSFDTSSVTTMDSMFRQCSSLISLDLSNFDTSSVTDMKLMFYLCSSLTSLDLSNFDTSSVTNMHNMFGGCSSLTSLDLSSFDTSSVKDMSVMFSSCRGLTSLDLSNFNTSSATNMSNMFYNCYSLTSLDLSNFNTSSVTNMYSMFGGCSSLTSLDISSFNTSSVKDMYRMFEECSSLTSLDIRNFTFDSVSDNRSIFRFVSSTCIVYVKNVASQTWILNSSRPSEWSTSNVLIPTPAATYVSNKAGKIANGTAVYYNPVTGKTCSDYTASQSIGTAKTGCLKWYIFNDEEGKDTVDMILDHNTTYLVYWNSSGSNANGPAELLTQLQSDTSSWTGVPVRTDRYTDPLKGYTIDYTGYRARLIEAKEIAKITGADTALKWDSGKPYGTTIGTQSAWYYLDGAYGTDPIWQTQVVTSQVASHYAWLFDYTRGCTNYGCNTANSNTYGYWTSSATATVPAQPNDFDHAWRVHGLGYVASDVVNDDDYYGARPVITIDKSVLSNDLIFNEPVDITITPNKWYTKDVSYLYCLSSNGEECTPNIPGVGENTTLNISENGKYKICTSVAGNGVTNIECSNSYVLEKMKVYDNGTAVYFNPETGTTCSNYKSSQSTGVAKTGCMKWYIFNDEKSKDTVDMILDNNTTYAVAWNSSESNANGPTEALTKLRSDTSSWTGVPARTDSYTDPLKGYTVDYTGYRARLIEANEIAKITGADEALKWDSGKPYASVPAIGTQSSWYFLDGAYAPYPSWQTQVVSSQGASHYAWLFDYTNSCTSYGCNTANNDTQGYWTSSATDYEDAEGSGHSWFVSSMGSISLYTSRCGYLGVVVTRVASPCSPAAVSIRPVITIDKSRLQ